MTAAWPDHFLWGAATAGHQVDGNDSTSEISFLEQVRPTVFPEPAGTACNSWEQWQDDLDLVASMGLNAYRFSTEWARIEPEEGQIDSSALDHYERMVDGCLERGLAPAITLSHFAIPHWFAKQAAWLSPQAPDLFAAHCRRVIGRIGDRVTLAVTLNEPDLPRLLSTGGMPRQAFEAQRACIDAASQEAGVARYRSGSIVIPEEVTELETGYIRAHRAAVQAVRSVRSDLPVGLSLAVTDESYVSERGKELAQARRKACYERWLPAIQGDDFIGVQNYEREILGDDGPLVPSTSGPNPRPINESGKALYPQSLASAVVYIHKLTGLPIVVTEHGVCTSDDSVRSRFIREALPPLADLVRDGLPIHGYFHWSLLDNFEWVSAYNRHFGLSSVDRASGTFARTLKPSAGTYRDFVRTCVL
ncbi:beta-glucosidase [Bombiscardovia nodaiensis]|uniref:Beta-glucosidase n=1 Tax=Bombiscardovia nodaiensis TaxID=2932181 RepID=A0ABN6SFW4_9BIFI|nr:beta-glucosidase [Bombiscardovia nodaiensis]